MALYTAGRYRQHAGPHQRLIATRAVQGAAMGAAVMCARAIIRDLYASGWARVMVRCLLSAQMGIIVRPEPAGWWLRRWWLALGAGHAGALFGGGALTLLATRLRKRCASAPP